MRALLVAVLMLACSGVAIADSGLHDCGTRLDGRNGSGWCHGTGSFALDVHCDDGSTQRSGTVYIQDGYGLVSASCFGLATGAELVMKS